MATRGLMYFQEGEPRRWLLQHGANNVAGQVRSFSRVHPCIAVIAAQRVLITVEGNAVAN